MDGRRHLPSQQMSISPGFELVWESLMRFEAERINAVENRKRGEQRNEVAMLVREALSAGTVVIFVRTPEGALEPVPTDAWRPYPAEPGRQDTNIARLYQTGRSYDTPLVLAHETFAVSGIALVDMNNWVSFSKHAGRWPPYEIPASVKLLLRFCEHRQAISEGFPLRKCDAIDWFRANWPAELELQWSLSDRQHKTYTTDTKKDNCPPFVSEFVHVVLEVSERREGSGRTSGEKAKALGERSKRIACRRPTDAEFEDNLEYIED